MKREFGWDAITRDTDSVVTVGTFDGVHRGHQAIVHYLLQRAEAQDGTSTLISFDPHPRSVVHEQPVPLLTTLEERAQVLDRLGLDRLVVIPFTESFAQLEPVEYVEEVLVGRIGLQEITIGYDHRFGKKRKGDVDLLRKLGETHGFSVDVIPAQEVDHEVVSSSKIRTLLQAEGDAEEAEAMLGRPYRLQGTVARGEGRGRQIGYPTANIDLQDARKLTPKRGVYAVRVVLPDGSVHGGMLNIGRRPTFEGMDVTIEVHIFEFDDSIYGETLSVEFLQRVRDEQKFDSAEDLVVQLSEDERHCKQAVEAFDTSPRRIPDSSAS